MRSLVVSACVLGIPVVGPPTNVEVSAVHVIDIRESARKVQITALRDGKPLSDVRLSFYLGSERSLQLSITTDQLGVGVTPKLAVGSYVVEAEGESSYEFAEMGLNVADRKEQISAFKMIIPRGPEVKLSEVESTPVTEQLREFSGQVVDQSGAIIPNAFAQVFRKEPPLELAAKVRADEEGKFSARLPAGSYVAFVTSRYFATTVVGFSIKSENSSRQLNVVLKVRQHSSSYFANHW